MVWHNKPGKRLVGLLALSHAEQNAPEEIASIASRESERQIRGCGLAKVEDEATDVEKLRAWLRANPRTKAAKAGK